MSKRQARRLHLRNGGRVALPLLVPSFSSKGFPIFEDEDLGKVVSDAYAPFQYVNAALDEAFLVSAYDLHFGYIPARHADLNHTEVVFIDSGGYETSPFFDSTEPIHHPFPKHDFTLADYKAVLNDLDAALPLVVASPDWHTQSKPFDEQISFAQEFLSPFSFTKSLVLKPGKLTYVRIPELMPHIDRLNAFDIVGVTEKELGQNLTERLKTVAELRAALDDRDLSHIPIHVWGGLDPTITPLYFFAGGEIFDGLSWLRYAFYRGMAVYRDAKQILEGAMGRSYRHSRMQLWFENLSELRRLTASLRMFEERGRGDFGAFEWHGEEFKRAFDELAAAVPNVRKVSDGR